MKKFSVFLESKIEGFTLENLIILGFGKSKTIVWFAVKPVENHLEDQPKLQSIGAFPTVFSNSLVFEKWRHPKKPL